MSARMDDPIRDESPEILAQLFDVASCLHVLRELEVEARRMRYDRAAKAIREQRDDLERQKVYLFERLERQG